MARPIAIITGASGGIGRACALALSASYDVALHYQKNAAPAEALAQEIAKSCVARAEVFQADLAAKNSAEELVEAVVKKMGNMDSMIQVE